VKVLSPAVGDNIMSSIALVSNGKCAGDRHSVVKELVKECGIRDGDLT
jgi:hypothetical protein